MENGYELVRKIYRKRTIVKYQDKARLLGNNGFNDVFEFLSTRLIISVLLFVGIFLIFNFNIILSLLTSFLFYILFTYFSYDFRINKRIMKLEKEAIFFFEIFIIRVREKFNSGVRSIS